MVIVFAAGPLCADILQLWSGSRVQGVLLTITDDFYVFRTKKGTLLIPRKDIQFIQPVSIPDRVIDESWIYSKVNLHANYGIVMVGYPALCFSEAQNIRRGGKSSMMNVGFFKRPVFNTHWLFGFRLSAALIDVLPEYNRQLWLGHFGFGLQFYPRLIGDGFFLDFSAGGSFGAVYDDGKNVSKSEIGIGMEFGGGYSIPLSSRTSVLFRISWYYADNNPRFNTIGLSGGLQW